MKRLIVVFILALVFFFYDCAINTDAPDIDGPVVTITSPTNNQEVGQIFQISGTVVDVGDSGVAHLYQKEGSTSIAIPTMQNNWSIMITNTNYGEITYSFYAVDNAGNSSAISEVTVERTSIPSIMISSPTNGSSIGSQSVNVSGAALVDAPYSISQVLVKVNTNSWVVATGTTSWNKNMSLIEGTNLIIAMAISSDGKTNYTPTNTVFSYIPFPVITIHDLTNYQVFYSKNQTLSGTSTVEGPDTIWYNYIKKGTNDWTTMSALSTNWSSSAILFAPTNTFLIASESQYGRITTNSINFIWKPFYGWTKSINGTSTMWAKDLIYDNQGYLYILGEYQATGNFESDWGGSESHTAVADFDIFLMKISTNGDYIWTKSIGGGGQDNARKITIDAANNLYIFGTTSGTNNFATSWGGDDTHIAYQNDCFVMKINNNDTYGWTRFFGISNDVTGIGGGVDSTGNTYVHGYYSEDADFGLDFGTNDIHTVNGVNADIFISKINSDGSYGWTKTFGSTYSEFGQDLAIDNNDNVYLSGTFGGTLNFAASWGQSDTRSYAAGFDIFVMKINSNGSYGWTRTITASGYQYLSGGLELDQSDNIYITGDSGDLIDFSSDWGGSDSQTNSGNDIFMVKINSDGSYGWGQFFNASANDEDSYDFHIDKDNNFYVTGQVEDDMNFGASWSVNDIYDALLDRAFVVKVNADRSYGWSKIYGTTTTGESGKEVVTDAYGHVYILGEFSTQAINFGAAFGVSDLKSSAKIFITKIIQ